MTGLLRRLCCCRGVSPSSRGGRKIWTTSRSHASDPSPSHAVRHPANSRHRSPPPTVHRFCSSSSLCSSVCMCLQGCDGAQQPDVAAAIDDDAAELCKVKRTVPRWAPRGRCREKERIGAAMCCRFAAAGKPWEGDFLIDAPMFFSRMRRPMEEYDEDGAAGGIFFLLSSPPRSALFLVVWWFVVRVLAAVGSADGGNKLVWRAKWCCGDTGMLTTRRRRKTHV